MSANPFSAGARAPVAYAAFLGGVENGLANYGSQFAVLIAVSLIAIVAFFALRAWAAEVGTGWGIIGVLAVMFLSGLGLWYYGHTTLGPLLVVISFVLILAAGARGKQRRDG